LRELSATYSTRSGTAVAFDPEALRDDDTANVTLSSLADLHRNNCASPESFLPKSLTPTLTEQEGNDEQDQDAGTSGTGSRDRRDGGARRRAIRIRGRRDNGNVRE
jgi:hypothetical protein